jgi:hypothetical protein
MGTRIVIKGIVTTEKSGFIGSRDGVLLTLMEDDFDYKHGSSTDYTATLWRMAVLALVS